MKNQYYIPTLADLQDAQLYLTTNCSPEPLGKKTLIHVERGKNANSLSKTEKFSLVFKNNSNGWVYEGRIRIEKKLAEVNDMNFIEH